jgi:NADH:ubiquinone oxidoreductase subunit 5 (subunit L)/multisubunit Na+/H+ antiporter MnhA subunit
MLHGYCRYLYDYEIKLLFDLAQMFKNIIAMAGAVTSWLPLSRFKLTLKKYLPTLPSQLGLMFLALGLGAYE